MDDTFVTVHRTTDAGEGELVAEYLRGEGIDARLLGGTSVTLVLVERRIEVPSADAARAAELVDAFLSAQTADPGYVDEQPDDGDDDDDDDEIREKKLSPLLGAGVAPVVPGGSHLYARRLWTGAAIAATQLVLVALAVVTRDAVISSCAGVALVGFLAFDLIFGQVALRAHNRGVRRTPTRQLASWLAAAGVVAALAVVVGPVLSRLKPRRQSEKAGGESSPNQIRAGSSDPEDLPFPLHLKLP